MRILMHAEALCMHKIKIDLPPDPAPVRIWLCRLLLFMLMYIYGAMACHIFEEYTVSVLQYARV